MRLNPRLARRLQTGARRILLGWLCLAAPAAWADTGELVLAVQPDQDEAATRDTYLPLANYITQVSGRKCTLLTHTSLLAYWDTIRKGKGYDLVLDDAHFTDYRLRKLGYTVLAKLPGSVTYSLTVRRQDKVLDPAQLVGKRIATLAIPSVGAARLNALYHNPARQPITVEIDNLNQGMQMLLDGKVAAALLPTSYVNRRVSQGADVRIALLTEPIPNAGLSAAPGVDPQTRDILRHALFDADKNDAGRAVLRALEVDRFDPATATVYAGQSRILAEYWGY
jgi:ABC-type phosphate/phosphonate transport system substrate-binding protein